MSLHDAGTSGDQDVEPVTDLALLDDGLFGRELDLGGGSCQRVQDSVLTVAEQWHLGQPGSFVFGRKRHPFSQEMIDDVSTPASITGVHPAADLEANQASARRFIRHIDAPDRRGHRTLAKSCEQDVEVHQRRFRHDLDATVGAVRYPAHDAEVLGLPTREPAIADALHSTPQRHHQTSIGYVAHAARVAFASTLGQRRRRWSKTSSGLA